MSFKKRAYRENERVVNYCKKLLFISAAGFGAESLPESRFLNYSKLQDMTTNLQYKAALSSNLLSSVD